MKKIVLSFIAFISCVCLASCGKPQKDDNTCQNAKCNCGCPSGCICHN